MIFSSNFWFFSTGTHHRPTTSIVHSLYNSVAPHRKRPFQEGDTFATTKTVFTSTPMNSNSSTPDIKSNREWVQDNRSEVQVYRPATTFVDPQTLEIREQPAILANDKHLLDYLYIEPPSKYITAFYLQTREEEKEADPNKLDLVSYDNIVDKSRKQMTPEELAATGPEFRLLYDYLWLDHQITLEAVDHRELSLKALRTMYIAHEAKLIKGVGRCWINDCSPLRVSTFRPDADTISSMYEAEFDHKTFCIEDFTMPGAIVHWWNPEDRSYKPYTDRSTIDFDHIGPKYLYNAIKVALFSSPYWKCTMTHLRALYDIICRSHNEHHRSISEPKELQRLDEANESLRIEAITEGWTHVFTCLGDRYLAAYLKIEDQMYNEYPNADERKEKSPELLQRIKAIVDPDLNEAVPQWMAFKFE